MVEEIKPTFPEDRAARKKRALELLKEAAAKAVGEGDPWAKYNLPAIPAERIIRHLFQPETQTWSTDETIVKIEQEPFTHGAMRFCYRMKKRAQPPQSATNHRFHQFGWKYASNYVAKAYQKDGEVDTSEEAKEAVRNDIMLQYEAQYWAEKFNQADPPTKIHFIRAYAIEFPDREGRPWLAVERYIAGTDFYGAGFVKHNTNAGFVDTDLRRVTPQVFSAFSFYASEGRRLVADIQGVGDLYTDPQVLSNDYRFGDGDLGPRGMALFFKSFRHCGVSDALSLPTFPLSKNELKCQAKYEDDEETVSDDDDASTVTEEMDAFQKLDLNRLRRSSLLVTPRDLLPINKQATAKRSNVTNRAAVSESFRASLRQSSPRKQHLHRTSSDVDEVKSCIDRARTDLNFTHRDFHRHASGELRARHFKQQTSFHKSALKRTVSAPMVPTEETRINLGKVHYQLAVLHGMCRFPDVVPIHPMDKPEDSPSHDAFSVLFHLSYAAALHNAPACLSLGRVHAGLDSTVSDMLRSIVPIDFEAAKDLLRRAMSFPHPPAAPKAAAGCLLFQILHDESKIMNDANDTNEEESSSTSSSTTINRGAITIMTHVLQETLKLMNELEVESAEKKQHNTVVSRGRGGILLDEGDRVEANYALEGTFYTASVVDVSEDGGSITVCYDDDGSTETLTKEHVRLLIPPTATQTTLGGPLSDEEAFGSERSDDKLLLAAYELKAELAELMLLAGDNASASAMFEEAADGAMQEGKMKTATEWSLKAAELQ